MSERQASPELTSLYAEVEDRFGTLPNFFRLAPEAPEITRNLWGFAKFGYLDNPLPPLFKERLFVYLSRFCEIRYCIARHIGFLVGLGRPAGDRSCGAQTPDEVVRLISRPLPRDDELLPFIAHLDALDAPLDRLPEPDEVTEQALFACLTHVFLQTPQAAACLDALHGALEEVTFQHLLVLLTFVRTAHYWTRVHPELELERDVTDLFAIHETLADCALNDPEAASCETAQTLSDELSSLRRERALWEEIERANGALKAADRRKDEFLATLAHELRNPLAPIRTGLEALKLFADDPGEMEEIRAVMERQAQQMSRLIDDLLDMARITQDKLELRRSRMDLNDALRSAVEATRPAVDEAGLTLSIATPDEPIVLDGDPHRLAQVFSNLLNNAAKYTPAGGRVELTAERRGDEAIVTVLDTGLGIPAEMQRDVFEMFAQLDRPLEKGYKGLGIGLTLVKRLVDLHGGSVELHSDGAGRGSTFRVRLPIPARSSDGTSSSVATDPPSASRGLRVLIVDDNQAAADLLSLVVKTLGHQVRTAYDGEAGVAAAEEYRPHIVLMDLGMPKLNGYEAAERIRKESWGERIALVALTGWGQEEDRRRTKAAGFDRHLVKPVAMGELRAALNELAPTS